MAGVRGIPESAAAVLLNVTVTRGTAPGHITAYPFGTRVPTASNLNFAARQTIANAVTVPIGQDGRVALYNGSTAPVDLVGDIAGYVSGGEATLPGAFVSAGPTRLLDTRAGAWESGGSSAAGRSEGPVPGGGTVRVPAVGSPVRDDVRIAAVVLNVTATRGARNGHVTAYDGEGEVPTASLLNFTANQTIANQVTVEVADSGRSGLHNGSPGSVHLIADIAGYYLN